MSESHAAVGAQDLSCAECRDLLSGYLDHELTPDEQAAVEKHLSTCTHCTHESTSLVGLRDIVRHWEGIRGSNEFHQQVMDRLIRESQMAPSKQYTDAAEKAKTQAALAAQASAAEAAGKRPLWPWILIAAGLAILALLALLVAGSR